MKLLIQLFTLLVTLLQFENSIAGRGYDLHNLIPGKVHQSTPRNGYERLSIYCYKSVPKHALHFWLSARLHINIEGTSWDTYIGDSSETVLNEYEAHRSSWSWNIPLWKKSNVLTLDPFNSSCFGISTTEDHSAFLNIIRIDYWRVLLFIGGTVVFLAAERLSSNQLLHYACGIVLGVTTSFLILFYLISKTIPKQPAVYGVLLGGWAISLYLLQWIASNIKMIAQSYFHYVLAYTTLSAFISFIICYRWGPVSNPRTITLIRWALKGVGLSCVFLSSNFQEASTSIVLLLILFDSFPRSWVKTVIGYWRLKFPQQRRLITNDEYHEEGARETIKALAELRQYCSSPESNPWKTMLRLKSPERFARFVEGDSHLSNNELLEYENESEYEQLAVTSDDSD